MLCQLPEALDSYLQPQKVKQWTLEQRGKQ